MANDIVKMVAKKANISEPVAQIAVDTVLSLLKSKLPPAVGSTLDSFLGSGASSKSSTATLSTIGKAISNSKTAASKSSKTVSNSKTAASKSSKTKKADNPLGDLGNLAGALGGLLGKK